jgi:stearoyl-CoA desaturase (delta-9 desaturase)
MKYFKLSTEHKLKTILILNHVLVFSIVFLDNIHWIYLLLSFVSWIIIGKIGGEIGFHRYFSHRSFKTSYWKSRLLLILGSLVMVGSSLSWCGTHRIHHAKTDTEDDPHSPHQLNWFKIWTINWKPFVIKQTQIYDLLKDKWQIFLHKWYFELCLLTILIIGIIDYKLLVFTISLTSVIQFHTGSFLVDIVCHKWGYRNFDTNDQSKNNIWANFIALGQGLHNNHHADPANYNMSTKWYEIDISSPIIKYLFIEK